MSNASDAVAATVFSGFPVGDAGMLLNLQDEEAEEEAVMAALREQKDLDKVIPEVEDLDPFSFDVIFAKRGEHDEAPAVVTATQPTLFPDDDDYLYQALTNLFPVAGGADVTRDPATDLIAFWTPADLGAMLRDLPASYLKEQEVATRIRLTGSRNLAEQRLELAKEIAVGARSKHAVLRNVSNALITLAGNWQDEGSRVRRTMATRGPQIGERRVRARVDDEHGFEAFDLAHDSLWSAPARPGLVSGSDEDDVSWILVRDVRRWIETNRAELLASADPSRPNIWWSAPTAARLESLYRAARGERAALRQARPTLISELRLTPPVWGLYRIHQSTGAWYVGISSNLRNRLYAHQALARLDFKRGDTVEVMSGGSDIPGRTIH